MEHDKGLRAGGHRSFLVSNTLAGTAMSRPHNPTAYGIVFGRSVTRNEVFGRKAGRTEHRISSKAGS